MGFGNMLSSIFGGFWSNPIQQIQDLQQQQYTRKNGLGPFIDDEPWIYTGSLIDVELGVPPRNIVDLPTSCSWCGGGPIECTKCVSCGGPDAI